MPRCASFTGGTLAISLCVAHDGMTLLTWTTWDFTSRCTMPLCPTIEFLIGGTLPWCTKDWTPLMDCLTTWPCTRVDWRPPMVTIMHDCAYTFVRSQWILQPSTPIMTSKHCRRGYTVIVICNSAIVVITRNNFATTTCD